MLTPTYPDTCQSCSRGLHVLCLHLKAVSCQAPSSQALEEGEGALHFLFPSAALAAEGVVGQALCRVCPPTVQMGFLLFAIDSASKLGGFLLPGAARQCVECVVVMVGSQGTSSVDMAAPWQASSLLGTQPLCTTAKTSTTAHTHHPAAHHEAREPATARPVAASVPIVRLHTAAGRLAARLPGCIDPEDALDAEANCADTGYHTSDICSPHPDQLAKRRPVRLC